MAARDCVLITGAAGFLGSHIARLAHDEGSQVYAFDDLSLVRDWPKLPKGVIRVFSAFQVSIPSEVTSIVHCAARSRVGESFENPGDYWKSNVDALSQWLAIPSIRERPIVFASSAAVYGDREHRLHETDPARTMSPYASTKIAGEQLLRCHSFIGLRSISLRLFNLAGAHPDGTLSENHDPETHLIPLAIDAALGRGSKLKIYGTEHDTVDGTQERDYVHVMDAARAFLLSLDALDREVTGTFNIGSGSAYSVWDVVSDVGHAVGNQVPFEVMKPRRGDFKRMRAMNGEAYEKLGWKLDRSKELSTMIEDALRSRR